MDWYRWLVKPHSLTKWKLLEEYLEAWGRIVSHYCDTAYYVDAFAGPGYWRVTGQDTLIPGSPVIAAGVAERLTREREGFRLQVIAVEKGKARFGALQQACQGYEVRLVLSDFGQSRDELIEEVREAGVPSFWLVDPCGLQAELRWVQDILSLRSAEVLFNYMQTGVPRALGAAKAGDSASAWRLMRMFGAPEFQGLLTATSRELLGQFMDEIREHGAYVRPFAVPYPHADRTDPMYYLIFATKNDAGFSIMKDVMGKLARAGTLFADVPLHPWGQAPRVLQEQYAGRTVTWRDIHQETDYHHRHLAAALNELMDGGLVEADPLPRDRNRIRRDHAFAFAQPAQPAQRSLPFQEKGQ